MEIVSVKTNTGNPHVWSDEGEVAPEAMPRRGPLLYKLIAMLVVGGTLSAYGFTLREGGTSSYSDMRIEASQSGSDSDYYSIEVPSGTKATVKIRVTGVKSSNISSKTISVRWNTEDLIFLPGEGSTEERTFTANASVTIRVSCNPGTHQVQHWSAILNRMYYTTEEWTYYQCAVTYSISVAYESLLPDLAVLCALATPAKAPVDEPIGFSFEIANNGGKPAAESVARVYLDGEQLGGDFAILALSAPCVC